jgi:lysophospholipase L1-like esterase
MKQKAILPILLLACRVACAQGPDTNSTADLVAKFHPVQAPPPHGRLLHHGDRLAICGDSITEQRMYSRLMEDYLTMCVPDLDVTVRQYGWSGERAPQFLARMTNDCLRFKPTLATTCYGMNDHEYRPYEERIGNTYRQSSQAIVEAFEANGARVIQGSPGCIGQVPRWTKSPNTTVEALNQSLCTLRNIGIDVATHEKAGFADVFWPMLTSGAEAKKEYGANYAIAGADGVHPGWAGHTVMAYAFLKAMGLDGDLGTFTVDLKRNKLKVSKGHQAVSANDGVFVIYSSRYPFCACLPSSQTAPPYPTCDADDPARDNSIRSAMTLIPFNADLNRLMLVVKNAAAPSYKITWGNSCENFSAAQLARGVNLAAEFPSNPFCEAFAKVDAAVAAKQAFETKEIKERFRSAEANADLAGVVAQCEKERAPLAAAVKSAFVPVTHTLKIEPTL